MKGVELKKLIQELRLYNKTPDIDISKKESPHRILTVQHCS